MICIVIKGPSYKDAQQQIQEASAYASCVELRLDYFTSLDLDALKKLQKQFSIPMIFTLRSHSQGGNYQKSEEERLQDLTQLATLSPEYLDIEYDVPKAIIEKILSHCPQTKLILSYHNFTEVPDLDAILSNMQTVKAHFYKIAVMPHNTLDALKIACWNKTHKNLIVIGMGPYGQITRILAPVIGSSMTYATLDEASSETAPGQLSAKTLIERYRTPSLNPQTQIFGLIGNPVNKSISDETHNHLFKQLGLNAVYIKLLLEEYELSEFLHLAKKLPIQGLSVTMPFKEKIIPLLDEVDEEALTLGAANTLVLNEGKFKGFNTDGIGALNAIENQAPVKDKKMIILGAGGAAKAIIYESLRRNAEVTILNRTPEKALALATKFGCHAADSLTAPYDILVNTTPHPMPISAESILPNTVVMDIKTRPKYTELLHCAAEKGSKIVFGYEMFREQALGQYKLWFKSTLSEEQCRAILDTKIQEILEKV